jgi:hypothetical protein
LELGELAFVLLEAFFTSLLAREDELLSVDDNSGIRGSLLCYDWLLDGLGNDVDLASKTEK